MEEQKTASLASRCEARRHAKEGPQTSLVQLQLDQNRCVPQHVSQIWEGCGASQQRTDNAGESELFRGLNVVSKPR